MSSESGWWAILSGLGGIITLAATQGIITFFTGRRGRDDTDNQLRLRRDQDQQEYIRQIQGDAARARQAERELREEIERTEERCRRELRRNEAADRRIRQLEDRIAQLEGRDRDPDRTD